MVAEEKMTWVDIKDRLSSPSTVLTDEDIKLACEYGFLIAKNYEPDQVNHSFYDLRVGKYGYSFMRKPADIEISSIKPLIIRPKEVVVVIMHEEVRFPEDVCGRIFATVGVMSAGVSYATTTVDPGYEGTLRIALINHGNRPAKLLYKQTLCKLEFERLGRPVRSRYPTRHERLTPVVTRKATLEEPRQLSAQQLEDLSILKQEAYAFGEPLDLFYEHVARLKEEMDKLTAQLDRIERMLLRLASGDGKPQ